MATPLFRPARFKWCTHSSSLSWDQGWVGGCVVNLSGGEWGHGVSVKRSTGFLERGWRIYSYCADKSKDLAHDWAPPSVCVSLSEMFVSKVIRLRCAIPYTNWFRHLAIFFPACAEHFNRNLMASQTWIGSFVHFTRLIWTSLHYVSYYVEIYVYEPTTKHKKSHYMNKHTFATMLHFNISMVCKKNHKLPTFIAVTWLKTNMI